MEAYFPAADPHQGHDRLGFAFFLALALHSLIIFGIGFDYLKSRPAATALDVTLAQHPTNEEIDEADYIAQVSQQGSGNITDHKNEITTDQLADYSADLLRDTDILLPTQVEQTTPHMAERTLTTSQQSQTIIQKTAEAGERESAHIEKEIPPAVVKEFASLRAQLDTQKQAYSRLPKVLRLTSASTRQADHAAYLKYWIGKVELTGNLHYPVEARHKNLFGQLQLAVTILPDGSVDNVEILSGSSHHILDQAAVETVRLASPFAPFPSEMKQWDKIEIIKTWRFSRDNRMRTQ